VTSPNRPPCGSLTPHDRHLVVGSFPLELECPGVPNLAEPARFEPDRAEYARVEVRYPSGVTYIVEMRGSDPDPIDGHLLFEQQSFEVLTGATDRFVAAPSGQRTDIALRGRVASALRTTDAAPSDRDARVQAQVAEELARIVESLCPDPDVQHAGSHCDFADAAAVIREYAGKGLPSSVGDPTGTGGTPDPEHPLDLCCTPLGCGHHINGHGRGAHCTEPGCNCRVWRDHVNCEHHAEPITEEGTNAS
jgi:hypothetical protein